MARRYVTRDGKRLNVDETEVLPTDVVATEAENHPVQAALNKGVSALTFGLLDTQATDKQYVKNLRAENPTATSVGEIGGEIVQGLLVPAAKALGLAGNLAIQGGLSGLGSQISESALNDRPVNMELLAGDVLSRAATGVVLGKGFEAGGKLINKVAGKAGELAASERVINAAGNIRKGALKRSLGLDDDLFKYADGQGFFASTSHEGVAAMAGEAERKAGYKATEVLDKAVEALPDYKPLRDRWVELSIESSPAARREMLEIEKAFKQGLKDVNPGAKRGGVSALFQEIPKRRGDFGGEKTAAGKGQKVVEPAPEAPSYTHIADAFAQHADDFAKAKVVRERAVAATSSFDLNGAISEAAIPAIFGGPAAGAAMFGKNVVRHYANQRGGYLAAKALEKIQAGKILPNVFKGFQTRIETMLATAPSMLGPFATILGHAAAEGTEALITAHSALVQSAQGPEYLARLGMTAETPEQTKAYGEKLAMLEALEEQKQKFNNDVDKAARSFFKGDSFESFDAPTKMTRDEFDKRLKSLEGMIRDPASIHARMPRDVTTGAPGLALESGQSALMAAQFLVDRAPKPNDLWKPPALRKPFEPGPTEIAKWQRYADAVENPRSAAVKIVRGQASPETIETVKTLYPNLFGAIQQKVMTELSLLMKPLVYAKKSALVSTFGPQILGITPQAQLYLQSVHQAARPPPEMQQGPSQDGRQMVNSNKNLQTQTDRVANRSGPQ